MRPKTKIEKAVDNLIAACGYDKSELATESFYYLLRDAVDNLAGEIEQSHAEGLCLDMATSLAQELQYLLACPRNPDHDAHDN